MTMTRRNAFWLKETELLILWNRICFKGLRNSVSFNQTAFSCAIVMLIQSFLSSCVQNVAPSYGERSIDIVKCVVYLHARDLIIQATVLSAPLVRQPFISGSTLAATNVVAANSGLVDLGVGLGLGRSGSIYGTQTVVADSYGSGSVVKIH